MGLLAGRQAKAPPLCLPLLTTVVLCRWCCCRPREPPAPVLQGPRGPFGRPGASGSAGLSAPVVGQATAFKRDGSQVSAFLCFSTPSAWFVIHYSFFLREWNFTDIIIKSSDLPACHFVMLFKLVSPHIDL